jgi:hypothetical protein
MPSAVCHLFLIHERSNAQCNKLHRCFQLDAESVHVQIFVFCHLIENFLTEHSSIFAEESDFKGIVPKLGYCDVFGRNDIGLKHQTYLAVEFTEHSA